VALYVRNIPIGRRIYEAAHLIEMTTRDSAIYYPILTRTIKHFLANNCFGAIAAADSILEPSVLNDNSFSDKIIIYPNPTTGLLEISVTLPTEGDYKIEVYNPLGELVEAMSKSRIGDKIRLDLSDYVAGIYLIKLSNKGEVHFYKIVKE